MYYNVYPRRDVTWTLHSYSSPTSSPPSPSLLSVTDSYFFSFYVINWAFMPVIMPYDYSVLHMSSNTITKWRDLTHLFPDCLDNIQSRNNNAYVQSHLTSPSNWCVSSDKCHLWDVFCLVCCNFITHWTKLRATVANNITIRPRGNKHLDPSCHKRIYSGLE